MASIDRPSRSDRLPPRFKDLNLASQAFVLAFLFVCAALGYTLGGWIGLIVGLTAGAVAIPVVVVGVTWLAFALIRGLMLVFSIDQLEFERMQAAAEAANSEPGAEIRHVPRRDLRPQSNIVPLVVISATTAAWVTLALPRLRDAESWRAFFDLVPLLVILPIGLIGFLARHWIMALTQRFDRGRTVPISGVTPPDSFTSSSTKPPLHPHGPQFHPRANPEENPGP